MVTGPVVLLPAIDGVAPEEAILQVLAEEVGYTLKSVEPEWVQRIELPIVPGLQAEVLKAQFYGRLAPPSVQVRPECDIKHTCIR